MKNNIAVSVIVPVYEVEKYIACCIQSLLDQTYENFEAIIIDDGSTDQSIQIAKNLAGHDSRFIFLSKENGGQSTARNVGLEHVRGAYIMFLDADDYWHPSALSLCMKQLQHQEKVDVVIFGTCWVNEAGKILRKTISNLKCYYDEKDYLLANGTIETMLWNKIYKATLFENDRFIEGIIYEDSEMICRLLYQKNIMLIEEYLYYYVQREGSTMNSYNYERSLKSLDYVYQSYQQFLMANGLWESHQDDLERYYIDNAFFAEMKRLMIASPNYKKDVQKLMKHCELKKIDLKNIAKHYGVTSAKIFAALLFQISPSLLRYVYKLVYKL